MGNREKVKFVNMSLSSFEVFSQSSIGFTDMLKDLNVDEQCRKYYVKKSLICVLGPRTIYSVNATKNGTTRN